MNFCPLMKAFIVVIIICLFTFSCVPLEKISRHDFDSGYYKIKTPGSSAANIYLDLKGDSVTIYDTDIQGKSKTPDKTSARVVKISEISQGGLLYNSTLVRKSIDFDLSTVLLKYRNETEDVPNQLSYNVNAVLYCGIRRDFFMIRSHPTPLNKNNPFIRQIGLDIGLMAGMGITPVNATVTKSRTLLEYDGWFFQKGIAAFLTFERMTVGISIGVDNLLDKNSNIWIYNQKPWIGLVLGIANF
jgi:hypothetical protein